MTEYAAAFMPDPAPLTRPEQTFSRIGARREMQRRWRFGDLAWRLSAFIPTVALTVFLSLSLNDYLGQDGVMMLEAVVLTLVALTFVWLAFSVNTACLGLIRVAIDKPRRTPKPADPVPMDIALLIPIYNETTWDVFGNASAMLKELTRHRDINRYALFILSDTRDPELAAQEERAFGILKAEHVPGAAIH